MLVIFYGRSYGCLKAIFCRFSHKKRQNNTPRFTNSRF